MSLDGVCFLEGVSPDSSPSWRMSGRGRVRRLRSSARFDADAESCESSLKELSFDSETDTTPRSSRKRLDFSAPEANATKMCSPFNGGNVAARIPTQLFYGARASPSARLAAVPVFSAKTVPRSKKRPLKKRYRLKTGVRHGIKKPKCKTNSTDDKNALKMALKLMDDSPLNEYIAKYVQENKIEDAPLPLPLPAPAKTSLTACYDSSSDNDEDNRAPRKFFKSSCGRRRRNGNNLIGERKRKGAHNSIKELIADDEETHFAQEKCDVNKLLDQWVEEDIPENEPHISQDKEPKTVDSNDSIDICSNEESHVVTDLQFMQVDDGYILVDNEKNDEEITDDLENIDTQIEILDRQISEIAKNNNLNPNIFLINPRDSNLDKSSHKLITSVEKSNKNLKNSPEKPKRKVLFPLFLKNSSVDKEGNERSVCRNQVGNIFNKNKKKTSSDDKQYMIDAGQKSFGAIQCRECGVIYQMGNATDEVDHLIYHDSLDILKFNGWKNEKFCGQWGEGRVIVISPGDPSSHWERVNNLLNRVVHPQLGFAAPLKSERLYKAFLFIEKKLITGCLIAEPLQKAHKLIEHNSIDCCSRRVYPVKCGVSRMWTHKSHRKKGIATKLMNAMRTNFMFGHILACEEIAFSSPTPLGKSFIEKYCQVSDFNVYLD